MKNIIPRDTRYVPFTQQKSCCVPASISMIMYRLGVPLVSQEELGYHLGLVLDKESRQLFWSPRAGKKPPTGYGVQTYKDQFSLRVAFKKLHLPIKVLEHHIDSFADKAALVAFISTGINDNKHFMAILGNDVLNGTRKNGGHACVIDRIYPKRDIIRLIDPSVARAKWREIKIAKFIKALKLHPIAQGKIVELYL